MAVTASVQEFLRTANVAYTVFPHLPAYTAQEEAAVTHVPGRDWAKAVICFADHQPIQAVVPADLTVNLERLLMLVGAETIRLAREDELGWLFPDCERGAMPPLGPLYRQRVFVDEALPRRRGSDRVQRGDPPGRRVHALCRFRGAHASDRRPVRTATGLVTSRALAVDSSTPTPRIPPCLTSMVSAATVVS